ncbi:MAG: vWA domain-containing protein [Chloroflexota bacterium]|nr:vWA domain-containing protein [Chloroflexota bacterium]
MAFNTLGKSRVLSGCFLGIGLAFLLVWPSTRVWGQGPGGGPATLDIILLIDNSPSMSRADPVTGAPPSDPEGLRIQAAQFLVDYLGANAEVLGANHRVGVASFGGVVGDLVPLRLLRGDTVRAGIQAEAIELTNFHGPLQFALRELKAKSVGTGNRMAVLLFTDGRPNLADAPVTEQELRAYYDDLTPLVDGLENRGVSLFLLGIGGTQEDQDNWMRLIPPDHYIPITSTTELTGVYHDIVADLTGAGASKDQVLPAGQATSIEVEPYLEHVFFSFVKSDPAIRIVLIPPTGVILTPTLRTDDIPCSIYGITNPDAGEWEVFWEGEGGVRYWVDKQSPLIQVEPIEPVSLAGQPITITASLVRNNEPIKDLDLHLEAEIILSGGGVFTQSLSPVGGGHYMGVYEDMQAEGIYTVTAKAVLDDRLLSVRLVPTLVEVSPSPEPTKTPMPKVVTPMLPVILRHTPISTPAVRLADLILVLIVAGLGMTSWLLHRKSVLSEREKRMRVPAQALDEVKRATSLGRIEEIVRPIERDTQMLGQYSPSLFAVKVLRLYGIEDVEYAEQELKRYAGSKISAEKEGAGIAVFNLLIREEPRTALPRLYALIRLGCDSEVLQYARRADAHDVPGLKEADVRQEFRIAKLCGIYSGLLGKDDLRLPRLEMEVMEILARYQARDLLALYECIRDSKRLGKGPGVVPVDVPPLLRESDFAGIPQLRPIRDILVQFDGIGLHPPHTQDNTGFLDILKEAQRQLIELEEDERALPEWYMLAHLFESWRDFIERELSGETTTLIVKPVTKWFPNNVGPGEAHVAWILHNEGPSSAEIHCITLCLGERELECDTKGDVLLCGDQKRMQFTLGSLADSELQTDLNLTLAVSLSDGWERRTERISYPHRGFTVLEAFRGRVIGEEIVGLLQSNDPLTADELRQYCLEANLYVHCNQLALLQLLEYSGGYPLFVHILLIGLIKYLKDGERWKTGQPRYVTCAHVPEIVKYIIDWDLVFFSGFVTGTWVAFPVDERAVIEALLESTRLYGSEFVSLARIQTCLGMEKSVVPAVARLEAKGMVEKRQGRYRLRARLLEEWLRARQGRDRALQSA